MAPAAARCCRNDRRKFCVLVTITVVSVFVIVLQTSNGSASRSFLRAAVEKGQTFFNAEGRGGVEEMTIPMGTISISEIESEGEWKAVVVGEGVAPARCRPLDCHFLRPEEQEKLGLGTAQLLPSTSPARKNYAVLYAIGQGAKLIYESDHGDVHYFLEGNRSREVKKRARRLAKGFSLASRVSALAYAGAKLFNPFWHFGQASVWPRGFPLSAVGHPQPSKYILFSWPAPLIQHQLVNGEADVDAEFRMTRNLADKPLNLTFDRTAPNVILPSGVLAPVGGHDTLFRREAFWALVLPSTPGARVSDIWRGYWSQRLLWEIGGTLSFLRPSTDRVRSRPPSSVEDDFRAESELYLKASKLVAFLHDWACRPDLTFTGCLLALTKDMAVAGFWQQADVDLITAWMNALQKTGYVFPPRVKSAVTREKLLEHFHGRPLVPGDSYDPDTRKTRVIFHPVKMAPPLLTVDLGRRLEESEHLRTIRRLQTLCPSATFHLREEKEFARVVRPRTLLVTEFNNRHYDNIPHLERNNRHRYPTLLYCGDNITDFLHSDIGPNTDVTFVEASVSVRGFTSYECLIHAIDMGYDVDAFFFLSEDVLINFWNLDDSLTNTTWTVEYKWNPDPSWVPWKGPLGISTITKTLVELNAMARHDLPLQKLLERVIRNLYSQRKVPVPSSVPNSTTVLPGGLSDVYQLSAEDAPLFLRLAKVFRKYNTYMEAAVPFILSGLHGEKVVRFTPGMAGYGPETFPEKYKSNLKYLHPVKWRLAFRKQHLLDFLCKNYYPRMFQEV